MADAPTPQSRGQPLAFLDVLWQGRGLYGGVSESSCLDDVFASAFAAVGQLKAALRPDYVVIGGGNVKLLKEMPPGARRGDNADAFPGGFRLWAKDGVTI